MTLKLRNLLLSIIILYSSLPSSIMWRSASSEGMFARMALRQTGSPSCDISIFSSLVVMASYRTVGSSYSSGDVKWSWKKHRFHTYYHFSHKKPLLLGFPSLARNATWCSLRDIRTPGATTRFSRSMSANTHSSLGDVMRKSPLKSAWRP